MENGNITSSKQVGDTDSPVIARKWMPYALLWSWWENSSILIVGVVNSLVEDENRELMHSLLSCRFKFFCEGLWAASAEKTAKPAGNHRFPWRKWWSLFYSKLRCKYVFFFCFIFQIWNGFLSSTSSALTFMFFYDHSHWDVAMMYFWGSWHYVIIYMILQIL